MDVVLDDRDVVEVKGPVFWGRLVLLGLGVLVALVGVAWFGGWLSCGGEYGFLDCVEPRLVEVFRGPEGVLLVVPVGVEGVVHCEGGVEVKGLAGYTRLYDEVGEFELPVSGYPGDAPLRGD